MKTGHSKTCQIDTSVYEMCPKNCRSILKSNNQLGGLKNSCIAKYKMNLFLEGETTFNVGISAFYQAHPDILNEFINERKENMELISYYLSISDPDRVTDIVEGLSDSVIYNLFKENYESFLSLKDDYKRSNRVKNFFQLKSNRFWEGVSFQKICRLIAYIIRNINDYEMASQFLVLLPVGVVSKLQEFSGLSQEEEKNLYLGLGDSIYELPITNPGIYDHMVDLLKDEMEIFIVLSTMEELVRRQQKILDITTKLIDYYDEYGFGLSIQNIYSELNGLEVELISEILNQLKEKKVISDSQKDMLQMVFAKGNIDFLKSLKEDILR